MGIPKKYFHDRTVLLLISLSGFLVVFTIVMVLLSVNFDKTGGYIVDYRSSLGLDAYRVGSLGELLAFIGFSIIVFVVHVRLSMLMYTARRHAAIATLGLGLLLLILSLIVSYSLLRLR